MRHTKPQHLTIWNHRVTVTGWTPAKQYQRRRYQLWATSSCSSGTD